VIRGEEVRREEVDERSGERRGVEGGK